MFTYRYISSAAILISAFELGACSSSDANPSNNSTGGGGGTSGTGTGGGTDLGGRSAGATGGAGGSTATNCHAPGTLTVTNQGFAAYMIDGVANPTLTLCRGNTYTFAVNAPGHPFYINSVQGIGMANAYNTGVLGNGVPVGDVVFAVGSNAPDTLYYDCSIHAAMTGTINIVN